MKRSVTWWFAAALLSANALAGADPAPPDPLPQAMARELALRVIELAESEGLPPRRPDEFAQARDAVLALVGGGDGVIERGALYARLNAMLDTLDADGHSRIATPAMKQARDSRPLAGAIMPRFAVVDTPAGKVLHWTPTQIVVNTPEATQAWLKAFVDDAAATPGLQDTCALVVDLSAQRGGSARAPMIALHPLFSRSNSARFVSRQGRQPLFPDLGSLREQGRESIGGSANPLARFAGLPTGVIVSRATSSAGEMLLVALLGEGARVQSFGTPSQGSSTANRVYPMPDGGTLALSVSRYALGEAAPFRGSIPPQHALLPGESRAALVRRAGEWAAAQSPRCKAAALPLP